MLAPLNRYINTLIPSPAEKAHRLKPFNDAQFFASLKTHGSPLPFKSPSKQRLFYERWLRTPAFGLWLARQEEMVGDVLASRASVGSWMPPNRGWSSSKSLSYCLSHACWSTIDRVSITSWSLGGVCITLYHYKDTKLHLWLLCDCYRHCNLRRHAQGGIVYTKMSPHRSRIMVMKTAQAAHPCLDWLGATALLSPRQPSRAWRSTQPVLLRRTTAHSASSHPLISLS